MQIWINASDTLLAMIVMLFPSPRSAQTYLVENMLGGYIVGRMTFYIMYLRLRSFLVTASALKSRRTPRLGFRNLVLGVEVFFCAWLGIIVFCSFG